MVITLELQSMYYFTDSLRSLFKKETKLCTAPIKVCFEKQPITMIQLSFSMCIFEMIPCCHLERSDRNFSPHTQG